MPTLVLALGIALKGALVLAVALLLSRLLRGQSAALRHTVWTAAFLSLLLIPLLSLALPPLRVLPAGWPDAGPAVFAMPTAAPAAPASAAPETPVAAAAAPMAPEAPVAVVAPAPMAAEAPVAVVAPATTPPEAPVAVVAPAEPPAIRAAPAGPAPARAPAFARGVGRAAMAAAPAKAAWSGLGRGGFGDEAASFLVVLWLAGAGLALGWVAFSEIAVRWLARGARPADAPEWALLADELDDAGLLPAGTRLLEVDRRVVPFTFGLMTPVVLLPRAGRAWTREHRRHVLTHELAHIRRRDCLTHFLGRVACALHWFNPLAWVALREARLEREHACDDAVLGAGSRASGYAESLLATARAFQAPAGLTSAGLALTRRSHLSERLLAVLDPSRSRTGPRPGALGAVAAAGLLITLPVAALAPASGSARWSEAPAAAGATSAVGSAPAEAPLLAVRAGTLPVPAILDQLDAVDGAIAAPPGLVSQDPEICPVLEDGRARTVHVTSTMSITGQGSARNGNDSFVVWSGDRCSVVIHLTGKPTFTADESDLASLDRGRFTITHDDDGVDRVYDVRAQGGDLERAYTVDGKPAPMDAGFAHWRSVLILEYIRRSGYDVEGRTRRILDRAGVQGVLDEIGHLTSDWAAGQYFRTLLATGRVTDADAARVLDLAGRRLESDYELGRVLAAVPARRLEHEPARRAFVAAVRTMESDYEKRKALGTILETGSPSPALTGQLLEIAQTIESDYELASLLIGLADRGAVTGEFDAAYLGAVRTIESDYEKHRVLSALLKSGPRSQATLRGGLEAAATIGSDYELGRWLTEVATAAGGVPDDLRPAYFGAVRSIESSHERSQVLMAAVATRQTTPALVQDVIEAAGGIDSDYELATVLTALAERGLVTDSVKPAFRQVLDRIESKYERSRVLAALGERATN